MDVLHLQPDQAVRLTELPSGPCASGFYWLDLTHDEFVRDPEVLRDRVQSLANARIYDLHMQDAANLQHPSFFDATSDYDMLIFRKLTPGEDRSLRPLEDLDFSSSTVRRPMQHRLQEITTKPVTFFLFERLLVTVRNADSRTIEQVRARLLEFRSRPRSRAARRSTAKP